MYSCCPGESDLICVAKRIAAGWFGVDPPHLIRLISLGRSSWWLRDEAREGVDDAEGGEGLAVREVGALQTRGPCTCLHLLVAGASTSTIAFRVGIAQRWWCCLGPLYPMARSRAGRQAGPGSNLGPSESGGRESPAGSRVT